MGRESNASVGGIGLSLGLGQTKAAPEFGKRAVDSRRNGAYTDCAVSSNAGRLAIRQSIYRGYSAVCIRRSVDMDAEEFFQAGADCVLRGHCAECGGPDCDIQPLDLKKVSFHSFSLCLSISHRYWTNTNQHGMIHLSPNQAN